MTFEEWYASEDSGVPSSQQARAAWEAGRRAALEEAAEECRKHRDSAAAVHSMARLEDQDKWTHRFDALDDLLDELSALAHVDPVNISPERVDETAKRRHVAGGCCYCPFDKASCDRAKAGGAVCCRYCTHRAEKESA